MQSLMQSALPRTWTLVVVSISYANNRYTKHTANESVSMQLPKNIETTLEDFNIQTKKWWKKSWSFLCIDCLNFSFDFYLFIYLSIYFINMEKCSNTVSIFLWHYKMESSDYVERCISLFLCVTEMHIYEYRLLAKADITILFEQKILKFDLSSFSICHINVWFKCCKSWSGIRNVSQSLLSTDKFRCSFWIVSSNASNH